MLTLYGVAAAVLVLDQLSKWVALQFLEAGTSIPIIPQVFHFSLVQNTGIAFGLFQGHPGLWTIAITISLIVLLYAGKFLSGQALSRRLAYGFVLGGAAGNCIDRIRVRYVIDFLDFRIWPVFNLADSFITIGVILLIWFSLRAPKGR